MAFPTKKFDVQSSNYSTMIEVIAGAAVVAGEYVVNSEVAGFYFVDAAIGDSATVVTKSRSVKCFKKAAETWTPGEALYWDPAGPHVTNVAAALLLIGWATEDIAAADAVGFMEFDGFAGFLKA